MRDADLKHTRIQNLHDQWSRGEISDQHYRDVVTAILSGDGQGLPPEPPRRLGPLEALLTAAPRPTAASVEELAPGSILFSQWKVEEKLGQGGYGAVYRARELHLGDVLAVKILGAELFADPDVLSQFRQEVSVMRRLNHPRVVRVFDYREDPDRLIALLSMELIPGCSLQALLEAAAAPLPVPLAISILRQTLQGLDAAHKKKIIHRDISPGNILLASGRPEHLLARPLADPGVKVTDFGLAALADARLSSRFCGYGTPAFMPPESLSGGSRSEPVADLYSVGAVSYLVLTGTLPVGRFLMPGELGINVPPTLDALLADLLNPSPRHRPQTAQAALQRLDLASPRPLLTLAASVPGSEAEPVRRPESEPEVPSLRLSTSRRSPTRRQSNRSLPEPGSIWEENTTGLRFRFIPPANHGSAADHLGLLLSGFWLGEVPVTQTMWIEVLGSNPSRFTGDVHRPVESISWFNAIQFCNTLSRTAGFAELYTRDGQIRGLKEGSGEPGFGLPIVAAWEHAAQAGSGLPFGSGGDADKCAWYNGNSSGPQPVRGKPANAWGLYDMAGNVWEWCWDPEPTGPGEAASRSTHRLAKGGAWFNDAEACLVTSVRSWPAGARHNYLGLRLMRPYVA